MVLAQCSNSEAFLTVQYSLLPNKTGSYIFVLLFCGLPTSFFEIPTNIRDSGKTFEGFFCHPLGLIYNQSFPVLESLWAS